MNKQIKDFLFILVMALMIGCVAPTTQRVKPNEEAVAVEADIQREIAFKEAINSQQLDAKKTNALGGFVLDMLIGVFTGVNTQGMFAKSFAQAYSKEFESEADYVGLYMCELSGYDISDAAYFWRRMGVKHPGTIAQNHGASHPSPPERFVSIESTIKEIEQKKLANEILTPNINEDVILSRNPPPDSAANKIGF